VKGVTDMAREKVFSTLDLYLSSFIFLNGIQPKLELNNGRVTFDFPVSDALYRAINLYNSNELIPVADFVVAVKTLRGQMLSMRGQK
jgi:hypothetical protein